MAVSESQKAAAKKYDKSNMAYQTIKIRRVTLEKFKFACAARGDHVNTVLRLAMEEYIKAYDDSKNDQTV